MAPSLSGLAAADRVNRLALRDDATPQEVLACIAIRTLMRETEAGDVGQPDLGLAIGPRFACHRCEERRATVWIACRCRPKVVIVAASCWPCSQRDETHNREEYRLIDENVRPAFEASSDSLEH